MAIPKVCGIETEYGILVRGGESNPVAASSVLINAYVNDRSRRIDWDFQDETPGVDARGFSYEDALAPEVESHLVNAVLTNGARFYVDHAHPEISTPECSDALQALVFDRSAEEIVRLSMALAAPLLPEGAELLLHKNNSDGKGNSYGCHENFLVARETPFGRLVAEITPHFVTRQIYCGAGKVGCEAPGFSASDVPFQISQRADFFEEEVGLETTLKRPIVNTRDEPHCDPQKYRRLHVIVGDANMSEGATLLKLGTTSIVLSMIEDGFLGSDLALAHPVPAIRQISHDPTLRRTVLMQSGRRMTALDVQWSLLERASRYANERGLASVGDQVGRLVLSLWEEVLTGLAGDRTSVANIVDWVAKERLLDAYAQRHSVPAGDARLRAIDLQYHDMRPGKGLSARVGLRTFVSAEDVSRGIERAPETTRAYFRGECLRRWPADIVAANWDSMVVDVGRDPLRRIPMMEPLRGTKAHVGELLESSSSIADLVDRLGA
ncbi:MAG: proteasome accessory factor PafA2 [Actinobacteria bacterium]|nr:proteasome accessory factor PafA2 [Actinomycetota bacterium]